MVRPSLKPGEYDPSIQFQFNTYVLTTRVDGRDFLAWQRGESPRGPLDAQDLADWQANYAFGTLAGDEDDPARAIVVSEPSGLVLLLLAMPFVHRRSILDFTFVGMTKAPAIVNR